MGLTDDQVVEKFRDYAGGRLGADGVRDVVELVRTPGTRVRELAAALY